MFVNDKYRVTLSCELSNTDVSTFVTIIDFGSSSSVLGSSPLITTFGLVDDDPGLHLKSKKCSRTISLMILYKLYGIANKYK